jgi:xylulokinase
VANSLADCLAVLWHTGAPVGRVLLIGGGARSAALGRALADTLGMAVMVPAEREYVALGAARQAAWAATGELPHWGRQIHARIDPSDDPGAAEYRERYARMRDAAIAEAS